MGGVSERVSWAHELRAIVDAREALARREAELRAARPDSFLHGAHLVDSLRKERDPLRIKVRCSAAFADEVMHEYGRLAFFSNFPLVAVARTSIGGAEIRFDFEFAPIDGGDVISRKPWPRPGKGAERRGV